MADIIPDEVPARENVETGSRDTTPDPEEEVVETIVNDGETKAKEEKQAEFTLQGVPREKDLTAWELPKFMADYIEKYAREHVPDSDMLAWLEDYPPPSNINIVPELDAVIKRQLREDEKSPAVEADEDLRQVQRKIQDIVGPLGVAWAQLHQYMNKQIPDLDGTAMLDQLQKAATLVAHAAQKVSWYRRLHLLGAVGKIKDVREILRRESTQDIFNKNTSGELFSKEFRDAVKTERSDKDNVIDLFKPAKKKKGTEKKTTSSNNNNNNKFTPAGTKRPFPGNPFQSGGGSSRHNNNNGGRDGYRSRNPYNNNHQYGNSNYYRGSRGKCKTISLSRQHALNSNMASNFE